MSPPARCGSDGERAPPKPEREGATSLPCAPGSVSTSGAYQLHWRSSGPVGRSSIHLAPHHSWCEEPPPVPSARSSAHDARTSGASGPCATARRLQRVQPWAARLTSTREATRNTVTLEFTVQRAARSQLSVSTTVCLSLGQGR